MEIIIKTAISILNFLYKLMKILPVQKKVVFISRQSNHASLDINMLKKEINKQHPDFKTIVLCKKLNNGISSKIRYCFHMLHQMYHLATSQVVILDSYAILVSVLKHKKDLLVIQMWHSVGTMKKFGYSIIDMPEGSSSKIAHLMKMHHNYDYILCAGEGYRSHLAQGFNYPEEKIVIYPLPRVEALKDTSFIQNKRNEIFELYPELAKKKNIVYAPTFRKNKDEATNFLNAIDALQNAFSPYKNEYNLVIKTHPLSGIPSSCPEFSSFEMLTIADYLISDYSCIIYEGAILNTPLYFYTYDYENYTTTRAIYMDYPNEIPSAMTGNPEELLKAITSNKYDFNKHNSFLSKYVAFDRDNITKDIVDFIWAKKGK